MTPIKNGHQKWLFALKIVKSLDDNIYKFISTLIDEISQDFGIDRIAFFVKEQDKDFIVKVKIGPELPNINEPYPLEEELTDDQMENHHIIQDPKADIGFDLYIPIKILGKVVGVIALDDTTLEREFTSDEQETFINLAIILNEIIANKNHLFELVYVDALTLVKSRRFLQEKNGSLFEGKTCVAMLDIDYFKDINDRYGHQTGDKILNEFGTFITEKVRDDDIVIRYGGEEFLIIFNKIPLEVAEERLNALKNQYALKIQKTTENKTIDRNITFSAGLAPIPNSTDLKHEIIIEKADKALYKAKESGRNKIIVVQT